MDILNEIIRFLCSAIFKLLRLITISSINSVLRSNYWSGRHRTPCATAWTVLVKVVSWFSQSLQKDSEVISELRVRAFSFRNCQLPQFTN
jgi:hypothetical protein